jgi:hypothetical protein
VLSLFILCVVIVHCYDTPGDNLHIKPLLDPGQIVFGNEVSWNIRYADDVQ